MGTRIVVGLGNPGPDYEDTRHNVGFDIVDGLAARLDFPDWERIGDRLETRGEMGGHEVMLVMPLTFVNRSGRALVALYRETPFEADELLVCYDDFALPLGRIRIRPEGSAGGHNGMESVVSALGTEAIPRLRVGVAPESGSIRDASAFVLRSFRDRERPVIDEAIVRAGDAIECAVTEDLITAMNRYNPEPS